MSGSVDKVKKKYLDNDTIDLIFNYSHASKEIWVKKNPQPGEFSDIGAALSSFNDEDPYTNPYVIKVGPGVFVKNFTLRPGISVEGSGVDSTILKPSNPSDHAIRAADYSSIRDLTIDGVTGIDKAAVYHNSLTGTPQSAFYIDNVRFGSNDTQVLVEANSSATAVFINSSYVGSVYPFRRGFVATNGGTSNPGRIVARNMSTTGMSTPYPEDVFYASGVGCEVVINSIQCRSGGLTSGNFIRLSNGADSRILGLNIKGFSKGIYLENFGVAPKIAVQPILIQDCTTDIHIEHPGSEGSVFGSLDKSKIVIDSGIDGSKFSMVFSDISSSSVGAVVIGDIQQGAKKQELANLTKLVRESSTLGLISGGELSAGSGFTLNYNSGNGFLEDMSSEVVKEFYWVSGSLVLPSDSISYIFVNNSGVVTSATSIPSLEHIILLGRVVTDSSSIKFIDSSPMNMDHFGNHASDFLRTALGPVAVSGGAVSEVGTRQLNVTTLTYYFSAFPRTLSGASPATFSSFYRDGLGGIAYIAGQVTVPNDVYDDGSGTLQSLPAGKYAKHILYGVDGVGSDKYFLQIGQEIYNSVAEAQTAAIPATPDALKEGVIRIAGIIVQNGSVNFPAPVLDYRPRLGFAAPSSTGVSDHGSLSNLNVPAHHPWALWVGGGNQMLAPLNMGGQTIVNLLTANGVAVESHAARHNPGGSDAVALGSPVSIGTGNSPGSANSFPRSDHVHAHGDLPGGTLHNEATTSLSGFMSAADKTKLDGVQAGADITPISNSNPSGISDSSPSAGVSPSVSRSDHVHTHGSLGGGSLHAAATILAAGFMSAADKTKLNNSLLMANLKTASIDPLSPPSVTGTVLTTVLTLSTGLLPAGVYRLGWSFRWNRNSGTGRSRFRIRVDGVDLEPLYEIGVSISSEIKELSGFRIINLTNASHSITLEVANTGAQTTTVLDGLFELVQYS